MSNSIFTAYATAFKRRAAKVEADKGLVAKFLELAGKNKLVLTTNGNSMSWRKDGQVGHFLVREGEHTFISYYLTVKTVWSGNFNATITKIEKSVQTPNCGPAFEVIHTHETAYNHV